MSLSLRFTGSCSTDNRGREFVLVALEHNARTFTIVIVSDHTSEVEVTISTPAITSRPVNDRFYVPAGQSYTYSVSSDLFVEEAGVSSNGISIIASRDVVVYAAGGNDNSPYGGFMVMPVNSLGINYYTMTWEPDRTDVPYNARLAIVTSEDDTRLTIRLTDRSDVQIEHGSRNYERGDTFEVDLDAFEVLYLIELNGRDLTGTIVEGNERFAVFAGNLLNGFGSSSPGSDAIDRSNHGIIQMPANYYLGREFFSLLSTEHANTVKIKVLATEDDTIITINGRDEVLRLRQAGDSDIIGTITSHALIESNNPVLVMQYFEGNARYTYGTPAGVLLLPRGQMQNGYHFASLRNDYASYLILAVEQQYIDNIIVDGSRVRDNSGWMVVTGSRYYAITIELDFMEQHYVYSEDNVPIAAVVYGEAQFFAPFAYSAGMCLEPTRVSDKMNVCNTFATLKM